jgi:hypothetical protein
MTEVEWLACANPASMLAFLKGRGSYRKFRLFAIAGCYLCPPPPADDTDPQSDEERREQLEVVVRYVDGAARLEEVRAHWGSDGRSWPERPYRWAREFAADSQNGDDGYPPASALVPLLHDIFGNPFRPITFSPTWRTATAVLLARQMYEGPDFSAMPILADALQDAGCDNEDVLNHCRKCGGHVRGCWVVDLVLAAGRAGRKGLV